MTALAAERFAYRRSRARRSTLVALGSTVVFAALAVVATTSSPGWPRVRESFFNLRVGWDSLPEVLDGLWLNVRVLVAPEHAQLDAESRTRVSVVPLGADAVVTLAGLDYPLTRGVLPAASCLGLGNFIATAGAEVEVHKGAVAVLVESGRESFGGAPAPQSGSGSVAGARSTRRPGGATGES